MTEKKHAETGEEHFSLSDLARFFSRVKVSAGDCWLWIGPTKSCDGRPWFFWAGRNWNAYRPFWMNLFGSIEPSVDLDHLCNNPLCVNPTHLEAVRHQVNIDRRTERYRRKNAVCSKGHEFTPENTFYIRGGTTRKCRQCRRDYQNANWPKRAARKTKNI